MILHFVDPTKWRLLLHVRFKKGISQKIRIKKELLPGSRGLRVNLSSFFLFYTVSVPKSQCIGHTFVGKNIIIINSCMQLCTRV